MSHLEPCLCPLAPGFQRYAWGKPAADATGTVAAMFRANSAPSAADSLDPSTTFAETWMGTHPSCPSEVEFDGQAGGKLKLSDYLKQKGDSLAAAQMNSDGYDGDLPYLFKVMCPFFADCDFSLLHRFTRSRCFPSAMLSASSHIPPSSAPPIFTAPSQSTTRTQITSPSSHWLYHPHLPCAASGPLHTCTIS